MCRRLFKPLAALALLLFFTFGFFAVSLAHESPSSSPMDTVVIKDLAKRVLVQTDARARNFALECESWSPPKSAQPDLEERRPGFSRRIEPLKAPLPAHTHTPKVSFHILESTLLI